MKIKWTNNQSGESGFVASVNKDKSDFVNAESAEKAKEYSAKRVDSVIKNLATVQPQNTYEAVE